jgi:hypothetical protein
MYAAWLDSRKFHAQLPREEILEPLFNGWLLNTIDLPQPPLKVLKSNEIVSANPSSKIDVSKLLAAAVLHDEAFQ